MGAMGQASTTTIWVYRTLALGSSLAAAMYVVPELESGSCERSVQLARSKEPLFAREGLRRMYRAVEKDADKGIKLMQMDAAHVLGAAVNSEDGRVRRAAGRTVGALAQCGQMAVLLQRDVRERLDAVQCAEECEAFCEVVGIDGCALSERRRWLRDAAASSDTQRTTNSSR
ncbi:hypothetical protein BWQ96_01562 [Gracilariopsis chorda]|uniref:Uncharacterized protein n=1 Tax=Gracilariopsis chorda TaxID=448386 RepID=A0A2V3J5P8_9FLOR|nr:hypothetical protein BWQ96_01562 [Gracilariopsis chorda]|eukprot:PXF48710.1 hypothetical protein BWQ96_01562 [Gracilariopsis chorda]